MYHVGVRLDIARRICVCHSTTKFCDSREGKYGIDYGLVSASVCRRVIIFIKVSSPRGSCQSNQCYLGIKIVCIRFWFWKEF
jgi:hypothetical protein